MLHIKQFEGVNIWRYATGKPTNTLITALITQNTLALIRHPTEFRTATPFSSVSFIWRTYGNYPDNKLANILPTATRTALIMCFVWGE